MKALHQQAVLDLLGEAARDGQLGGRVRVRGVCMAPLLEHGDEVTLAAPSEPVVPGQIVVARLGGELLCHRLLWIDGGLCELAGDTDLRLDRVLLADLLGRVVEVHTPRFGGARLELDAPSFADRLLASWQLWSCRCRGFWQLRLEGSRRWLLVRRAGRQWHEARLPP
jgi:hypothetical protein